VRSLANGVEMAGDKRASLQYRRIYYLREKIQNPLAMFITLNLLLNLRMGPKRKSVTLFETGKLTGDKQFSLQRPFVGYKENEVF
jgi:hypothetical protein